MLDVGPLKTHSRCWVTDPHALHQLLMVFTGSKGVDDVQLVNRSSLLEQEDEQVCRQPPTPPPPHCNHSFRYCAVLHSVDRALWRPRPAWLHLASRPPTCCGLRSSSWHRLAPCGFREHQSPWQGPKQHLQAQFWLARGSCARTVLIRPLFNRAENMLGLFYCRKEEKNLISLQCAFKVDFFFSAVKSVFIAFHALDFWNFWLLDV